VLASGVADPNWPADGRAVCTATGAQERQRIVSDGAHGVIITWDDARGASTDIYALRVISTGIAHASWPLNGLALCTDASHQFNPVIVSNGNGGAVVAWTDNRATVADIYAQHVLDIGVVDAAWPANGRVLSAAIGAQYGPRITSDGAGGAIVAWHDDRGTDTDLFTQHVQASGIVDPAWPVDGRALCIVTGFQSPSFLVPDGAGGALAVWRDDRSGMSDVNALHVLASGSVDASWPANGRAVCAGAGDQLWPGAVADGTGGLIVAWQDGRVPDPDIYTQRVARHGYLGAPEAEITSVRDVAGDQGGQVKLSWIASYLDLDSDPNLDYYDLLRSVPESVARAALARGTALVTNVAEVLAAPAGKYLVTHTAGATTYREFLSSVSVLHYVSGYSELAPTTCDSTGAGNPPTAFMVVARNSTRGMYWLSEPAYGYSVDDLAPAMPAPFTGLYSSGSTALSWGASTAPDFAEYRLHRGYEAGFVPGPENLVTAQPDTGYVDEAGAPCFYRLCAVDVHGNASPYAYLSPDGTTDVPGSVLPRKLALSVPAPNPVHAACVMRVALPHAATVSLALFDQQGRRVRVLAQGARPAGENVIDWDGRDEDGRPVPSGVYYVRLESGGLRSTQRLSLVR